MSLLNGKTVFVNGLSSLCYLVPNNRDILVDVRTSAQVLRIQCSTLISMFQSHLDELHHLDFFLPERLQKEYPSHVHIDIMRRAQGQGIGVRMIKTILATLKAKGNNSHSPCIVCLS